MKKLIVLITVLFLVTILNANPNVKWGGEVILITLRLGQQTSFHNNCPNQLDSGQLAILNADKKVVHFALVSINKTGIDASHLPQGKYIVRLTDGNCVQTEEIVIR